MGTKKNEFKEDEEVRESSTGKKWIVEKETKFRNVDTGENVLTGYVDCTRTNENNVQEFKTIKSNDLEHLNEE